MCHTVCTSIWQGQTCQSPIPTATTNHKHHLPSSTRTAVHQCCWLGKAMPGTQLRRKKAAQLQEAHCCRPQPSHNPGFQCSLLAILPTVQSGRYLTGRGPARVIAGTSSSHCHTKGSTAVTTALSRSSFRVTLPRRPTA